MSALTEFDAYARCYDLLYRDKDYVAEAAFVDTVLRRHLSAGALQLLELGCGTGGHAVPLAQLNHAIEGVDLSPRMLERAKARCDELPQAVARRLNFQQGDIRELRLGKTFDAVVSLFHVMSYQTNDDDLAAVLAAARQHLRPGGVLLFDFWYGPAVLRDPPAVRVKRVENDALHLTRVAEPTWHHERSTVDIRYQLFAQDKASGRIDPIQESHTLRYWFWPELRRHMEQAGLVPLGLWRWMTEAPAGPDDWLAYTVCRLPAQSAAG